MIKNIFLLILLGCTLQSFAQKINEQSIWQQNFYSIDSFHVDMKFYAGKKVIIYAFEATNPDIKTLKALDTLNRTQNNILGVIAIPVSDFGVPKSKKHILSIVQDSIRSSYPFAHISKGKKGSNGQHSLMQWITSNSRKNHFNIDIQEPGQFYIISTQGVLYAVLGKETDPLGKVMTQILSNEPKEN